MEHLTVEEAAHRLGISVATVRRWAKEGRLSAEKSGKQWIIDGTRLPGRRRKTRGGGNQAAVDLPAALQHVRGTDLKELPVPDVLRHADDLEDTGSILAGAKARLEGSPLGPAREIDVHKTAIFTRRMTILSMEDRVAYQAAVASFANRVEARTPDSVFSARLSSDRRYFFKRGPQQWARWRMDALKKLVPGKEWLVTTDLTAYFDTIPHRQLLGEIESLNVESGIAAALRDMLREWGPTEEVGLPQGPNASRLLGNLFLLPVDQAMLDMGWDYSRYLDDVRIVTATRAEAVEAVRQFQRECRLRGLIVSSGKTQLLHGDEARESLVSSIELAAVDYLVQANVSNLARKELKKILKQALKRETNIDTRKATFSLWRLAQLREGAVIGQVLRRLEDLSPLASVVAAYLQPFVSRKKVVDGLANFLEDRSRSYSHYLVSWLFAVSLEHPGPMPGPWLAQARRRLKDRNEPSFLRAITATVVGRGKRSFDISWIKKEIPQEHDPAVLRGFAVALHWAHQLDKKTQQQIIARNPSLKKTIDYLEGRDRLPSLVYASRHLETGDRNSGKGRV